MSIEIPPSLDGKREFFRNRNQKVRLDALNRAQQHGMLTCPQPDAEYIMQTLVLRTRMDDPYAQEIRFAGNMYSRVDARRVLEERCARIGILTSPTIAIIVGSEIMWDNQSPHFMSDETRCN